MIEVIYQKGLYLSELDLWLDPRSPKPRAFISHAHADHVARHHTCLCSEVTARLIRDRFRISAERIDSHAFHLPIIDRGFRIELLPAGHIAGSAMIHITRLSDQATLLYTGDFKNRPSRTAESIVFAQADTLIMETTFGLPRHRFPESAEVENEILSFVRESFDQNKTPVLLGYSLGKSQEALALMHEHDIPTLMHPAAASMTRSCIAAGTPRLPEPVEFDGHAPEGHVLIAPPHVMRSKKLLGLKSKRTAMLTGWALQTGAKFRYGVDEVIPFSDHSDHPGLMHCVESVRPQRVITIHGYTREFAAELRSHGIDAWSASGNDQLEFQFKKR
ncbi:MAG: MBL fold metallo-hydrolase RNA specificity domain-containing protein [Luteolibacter sp.]